MPPAGGEIVRIRSADIPAEALRVATEGAVMPAFQLHAGKYIRTSPAVELAENCGVP